MKPNARAVVRDIAYHLPDYDYSDEVIKAERPDWSIEKVSRLTGIKHRRIAAPDEFASDLAVKAAEKLFASGRLAAGDVDFVILCTMSPDYQLPATACIVQNRLGIPTTSGAFDLNLGCSGYVYGLGVARGLIETGQARNILFLTTEVVSKILHKDDKSGRPIFGDGASATWIGATEAEGEFIGPFDYGTSGNIETMGAVGGGARGVRKWMAGEPFTAAESVRMNGPDVFNFTLDVVPGTIQRALGKAGLTLDGVDLFVFHQANRYMMEHLRQKLEVPSEKFSYQLSFCGNTISSTIPIALVAEREAGRLRDGMTLLISGFGVGYSWGTAILRWSPSA